eukprot:1195835-Prorocentrum_minimum.AAC.8
MQVLPFFHVHDVASFQDDWLRARYTLLELLDQLLCAFILNAGDTLVVRAPYGHALTWGLLWTRETRAKTAPVKADQVKPLGPTRTPTDRASWVSQESISVSIA